MERLLAYAGLSQTAGSAAIVAKNVPVNENLRDRFVSEVADTALDVSRYAHQWLAEGREPGDVVDEALAVLAHSFLVILDGGTKLSDESRVVFLTDASGTFIGEGLHEWLPDFREGR